MDLEAKLDALFADPPERFMETRDALVKELKAAGDKEGSARVKALHKPTQAAHALNRLAREARPELEALFEAGRALASGKDFKAALDQQRAAMDAVFKKATGSDVPALMGVLRGALVDPQLTEQVRLGRFSKLPEVEVGFFGIPPAGAAPAVAEPPSKPPHSAKSGVAENEDIEGARPEGTEREQHAAKKPQATKADAEGAKSEHASGKAEAARAKREQHAAEKAEAERVKRERVEAAKAEAARVKREREAAEEEARLKRELVEAEKEAAALAADAEEAEKVAIDARRLADEAAERVAKLKSRH
jgi:hypothetical protein